ncbi:MAG: STAS-like domain-containing protein [Candidatus Saccharimonas sp.]|nr:MAG: STAS-like domain-containing protein [Candidatus Saccharimonas sp.]
MIILYKEVGNFAENKELAKKIREEIILPMLAKGEKITLDFNKVDGATQSFIHALISEAIREYGELAYENIQYKNTNDDVQEVIRIVYRYMQESLE